MDNDGHLAFVDNVSPALGCVRFGLVAREGACHIGFYGKLLLFIGDSATLIIELASSELYSSEQRVSE